MFLAAIVAAGLLLGCETQEVDSAAGGTPFVPEIGASELGERLAELRSLQIGEAYRAALAEDDALVQHQLLASVYARVDAENFAEIRSVFEEDLGFRTKQEAQVFGNLWAKSDPIGALSDVLRWTEPVPRTFASEEIMRVWVERSNFDAARHALLEVTDELPAGVIQVGEEALARALGQQEDYDNLVELLQTTQDADHRSRMIAYAMLESSKQDVKSWPRFAERVHRGEWPDLSPELKSELILQAVRFLASRTVKPAIEWYPKIADGEYSGDALSVIAEQWGRREPWECLEFLRARPESESPGMAKRALAYVWLQKDPKVARVELRKLVEEDPTMSAVIFPLVQFMMASELEESMELAQRVPDPRERSIVLKQGLMRWARRDPDGVDGYLATHDVPEPVRQAVQRAKQLRESRRESRGAS